MKLIPINVLCVLGTHCVDCRNREAGRVWRRSLIGTFCVDGEDFACPEGLPWGFRGCGRCHSPAHEVKDCPIEPTYVASPQNATAGGCGCSPPVA